MLLARVALPVPLGRAFTYGVPAELAGLTERGARVLCDFGSRKVLGVVLEVADREPEIPRNKLKWVSQVVDPKPVLPEELLGFLQEMARYYVAPIGGVIQLALPAVERAAARSLKDVGLKARVVGRLTQVVRRTEKVFSPGRGRGPELVAFLDQHGELEVSALVERWPSARSMIRSLEKQGLVAIEQRPKTLDAHFANPVDLEPAPELTPAQHLAAESIGAALENRAAQAFLLDGVTASGKTEVYVRAVACALATGRSAIVLVPEIALTPQLIARFRARLGDSIAVVHSGLGEPERLSMWKALREGRLRVAVGARSALFAPVAELGLICVDEEHDGSFKQEEGVRYNARDMALLRAQRAGAVCVLGSATPSISSLALVEQGKLTLLQLPSRAHRASVLPDVEIVDLRRTGAAGGDQALLSVTLHRAIERVLRDREQAILFLNRRGFAPSLICDACGAIQQCPNCSVALTLHRSGGDRARCHYCDYAIARPTVCGACTSSGLVEEGAGTERIQGLLAERFPEARVGRMDRDVGRGQASARILDQMRRGQIDLLVGTQMVTKGHDLPLVTLVAVLNADAALSLPDFRAAERSFQLFVQVAGRAGRGERPGRVLIQTRQPEHPAIACAARHDVRAFVRQELEIRRELDYPPFSRLALIRCDAVEAGLAEQAAAQVAKLVNKAGSGRVRVLGPAPAPLARLRNRYRFHVLLRAAERAALRPTLLAVARTAFDRKVRVAIDVDPLSML